MTQLFPSPAARRRIGPTLAPALRSGASAGVRRIGPTLAVLGLLAALGLLMGLPAGAQSPQPAIQQASLRLWPEYDDPGLLVIVAGSFTSTVSLPLQVTLPLSAGARDIQATVQDASGELLSQPWQNADGKLTYTLSGRNFQVEYYLDRPPSGNQRELTYTFEAPYAIQSLSIEIQQPARATGFSVTPQSAGSAQGSDGLTYYQISRTNLAAGDRVPITIRYTKTDQGLSSTPKASTAAASTGAAASAAASTAPSTSQSNGSWLPYLLIGLGITALAGAGIYWWLQQRRQARPSTPMRRAASPSRAATAGEGAFCTQCGQQYRPGDRFCANCGAPRRG